MSNDTVMENSQKKDKDPKVLLSVRNYPPYTGGTAFILYDILRFFPSHSLVVVSGIPYNSIRAGEELPFPSSKVHVFWSEWLTPRIAIRLPRLYVKLICQKIVSMAKKFNVRKIYAHYPNSSFAVAAYLAAERLKLPLTIYFDILWEEQEDSNTLASEYERRIVTRSDQRFAITEYAVEYLANKHGVDFELIPHTIDSSLIPQNDQLLQGKEKSIHFAGGINSVMNSDSVLRLAKVVSKMKNGMTLDLYTPVTKTTLDGMGFPRENVRIKFVPRSELTRIQSSSEILYLPQAFFSTKPEMIRCNFPTKALEYMISGRPILVHSPKDSYLTDMARKHGFGYVVDSPDQSELEKAITLLVEDKNLQEELVRNAYKFARTRDSKYWSDIFYKKLLKSLE